MNPPSSESHPPRWAVALLRALLDARDRDAIAGDLLEEYREMAMLGVAQARHRYIRQVLSFARVRYLRVLLFAVFPGSFVWAATAGLAELAILIVLPRYAGLPATWGVFTVAAIMFSMAGGIARSAAACRTVFGIAGIWFFVFAAFVIGTLKASAFTPVPGVILFLICVPGAATQTSVRTSRIGLGIAAAVANAVFIALFTAATVSILRLPHPPLGTLAFLPGIAAMLGAVGAMFGKGFGRQHSLMRSPV